LAPEAPVPVFNTIRSVENEGMARNVYKNLQSLKAQVNIHTNSNWVSITKTRYVDQNTNHMFIRVDSVLESKYGRSNLKNIKFEDYDAVVISDYNKGFVSEKDIEAISQRHSLTFLDTKKILGPWCENVSFIKINNHEYERTRHMLSDKIQERLIVTMGSDGAKFNGIVYPVENVEIKDSSGAGDTFIAALTVEYLKNSNIRKAIEFANKCATTVVQKRGVNIV
tara:strand:+ start:368 stop:1039 length:672 start_codon:yes stop_codon:yes gene_type:complete